MKISVSPSVKEDGLAEVYQSVALRMALLRPEKGNYVRITPFVQCRDFLCDVYTFSKVGKSFEIYGCHFDPAKEKLPEEGVWLALKFPEKKKNFFMANLHRIHDIEKINGLSLTGAVDLGETTVIYGSAGWLTSCPKFSLYTSLLRTFCYKPETDWDKANNEDAKLLRSVDKPTFLRVLADLKVLDLKDFCGFDATKVDAYRIHHNSGFYSVFGSHREIDPEAVKQNSHWKHFKEQGWTLFTKG